MSFRLLGSAAAVTLLFAALALTTYAKKCSLPIMKERVERLNASKWIAEAVMVPMRDNVKLHTVVISPLFSNKTAWPVVIDRSPYGENKTELLADIFLLFDFVAIGQDMRGTCDSEGKFSIFHSDTNDGADTLAWIKAQPWCDGNIYEIGASADGIASFELALSKPTDLKSQFIIFATAEAKETFFPGGAYRYGLIENWINGTVPKQKVVALNTIKSHEALGPYWTDVEINGPQYKIITWPTVMWAGWYDIFLRGNLMAFEGYQKLSDPSVRGKQFLLIDPCGHCQTAAKFFPQHAIAGRSILAILQAILMFKGEAPIKGIDSLTFYVMGAMDAPAKVGNYFTTLPDWPAFAATQMYLHGDGSLQSTPNPAALNQSSSYKYDPANPTPTVGGNNLEIPCGPLDQSEVEKRDDVLVFTSAPLTQHMALTGPLSATLYVSVASVNDTDFSVKFTDVNSNGTSQLIQASSSVGLV